LNLTTRLQGTWVYGARPYFAPHGGKDFSGLGFRVEAFYGMVPRNAFRLLPSKMIDLRNAEAERGIGAKRQTWRSRVRPPAGPCRVSGEILKSGYLVALHLEGFQSFSRDFLITNIITKRPFLMVILPHAYTPPLLHPVNPPPPCRTHSFYISISIDSITWTSSTSSFCSSVNRVPIEGTASPTALG
jgi:hypothetical protein